LDSHQKKIINKWLFGYKDVYNYTLNYVKDNVTKNTFKLDWKSIRNNLKDHIKQIAKQTNTKVHDLDYAVKLVCQNYKSAMSNYKSGNIKHFRVRYWKNDKNIKIMDMEKNNFTSGSIRKNILGQVTGYYNGEQFNFKDITCDCKLQRNIKFDSYTLLVPEKIVIDEPMRRRKYISLDPGIRTFMTGITESKIVEIGKNVKGKVLRYIKRNDKIQNNTEISNEVKVKNDLLCKKKIDNYIDELQWKTINYLTKNYDNIFIGNMSTKGIISKTGNLNKMMKRILVNMKLYVFHQRLKYKCFQRGTNYKLVNEYCTSKMCSNCGHINEHLGSSKVFECGNCDTIMGRDVNGCRGILIKSQI